MSENHFNLDKNELLAIESGRAFQVRIRYGEVWLTQHKDGNDYLLQAGAIHLLNGKGTTLIKAYRPTMIEVHYGAPARSPHAEQAGNRPIRATRVLANIGRFLPSRA